MLLGKRKKVDPEIPTSALPDIVFLLLIFFLVTTTIEHLVLIVAAFRKSLEKQAFFLIPRARRRFPNALHVSSATITYDVTSPMPRSNVRRPFRGLGRRNLPRFAFAGATKTPDGENNTQDLCCGRFQSGTTIH